MIAKKKPKTKFELLKEGLEKLNKEQEEVMTFHQRQKSYTKKMHEAERLRQISLEKEMQPKRLSWI